MKEFLLVVDDESYDFDLLKFIKVKLNSEIKITQIITLFDDNNKFKDEFNCSVRSINEILKQKDYFSNNDNELIDHNIYKKFIETVLPHNISLSFNHTKGEFDLDEIRSDFLRNLSASLELCKQNNIGNIFFTNIPHNQFTVTLFKLAEQLKIKVIILRETIVGNYIIENSDNNFQLKKTDNELNESLNNFLNFLKTRKNNLNFSKFRNHYITEKKFKKLPFFLHLIIFFFNRVFNFITEQVKNTIKLILNFFTNKYQITISDLFKKKKFNFSESKLNIFEKSNLLFKDDLKKFNYYKMYMNKVNLNISKTKPFIYFPLHYQPEATTVPYGDFYFDQINAIKILSSMSEKFNFKIYVKEHPDTFNIGRTAWTMGMQARSYNYYNNIANIKNVSLIDINENSEELVNSAICVSTVTGTTAIEALYLNKHILIFGNAWYLNYSKNFIKYENINQLEDYFNDIFYSKSENISDFDNFIKKLNSNSVFLSKSGIYNKVNNEIDYLIDLIRRNL